MITSGYIFYILNILSLFAIFSGILVVSSKNPIISVLFLIGLFATISIYLIMLGLSFIGLSYLIVYVGAISILFLFILMLINIRISELQSNNTSNSIILAIIIVISFNYPIFLILPYNIAVLFNNFFFINEYLYSRFFKNDLSTIDSYTIIPVEHDNMVLHNYISIKKTWEGSEISSNLIFNLNKDIFFVSGNIWDGYLAEDYHITAIGNIMYTNYNIWLIIASFILLLAMVGAIVITIRPK